MAPPPDLSTPAGRDAYRSELRGVAPAVRGAGVGLACLGLILSVARAAWLPEMPGWIPMSVILIAVATMVYAIVLRTRYHARRMRGE